MASLAARVRWCLLASPGERPGAEPPLHRRRPCGGTVTFGEAHGQGELVDAFGDMSAADHLGGTVKRASTDKRWDPKTTGFDGPGRRG